MNETFYLIDDALSKNIPVYFNDICFDILPKETTNKAISDFNGKYKFLPIGKINIENYEYIIRLRIYNFTIFRLDKR